MRLLRLRKLPKLNIRALFTLAALSAVLYAGLLYIQKQHLIVLAQDSGSAQKYTTAAGDGKSLRCDGFTVTEVAADGTTKALEDCSQKQQTCYVWNDGVKQQSYGTCLYNPPVASSPGGAGCPTLVDINANRKTTPETCKYFNPSIDIFDTSEPTQDVVNRYTQQFFADAQAVATNQGHAGTFNGGDALTEANFRSRVEYIVTKAKEAGLNPVMPLGFWRTESAFSTYYQPVLKDLGCALKSASFIGFRDQVACALGLGPDQTSPGSFSAACARSKDAKSYACRKLDRSGKPELANYPLKLPISTYDDYMESYGSRNPNLEPGKVNKNCIHTYNMHLETAIKGGFCKATAGGEGGGATQCAGTKVAFDAKKQLLPLPNERNCASSATGSCGRPGTCVVPKKIVMHIDVGGVSAQNLYEYFYSGSPNGSALRGVASHFAVGQDGETIQMVEMLDKQVEVAYAVGNYVDHISIEMVRKDLFNSRNDVPKPQYDAVLKLVKQLMKQYNIPVGNIEYTWKSSNDGPDSAATPGVYGHYQLNPSTRTDPGAGFMRDFREDLQK